MQLRNFACALLLIPAIAPGPVSAQAQQPVEQQQIDQCVNADSATPVDTQIEACTAAIQSNQWSGKDIAWAYYNRGRTYSAAGDAEHAVADLDEAIRLDPTEPDAHRERGLLRVRTGALEAAVADFDAALQQNPQDAVALYSRGVAKLHSGDAAGQSDIDAAKALQADIAAVLEPAGISAVFCPSAENANRGYVVTEANGVRHEVPPWKGDVRTQREIVAGKLAQTMMRYNGFWLVGWTDRANRTEQYTYDIDYKQAPGLAVGAHLAYKVTGSLSGSSTFHDVQVTGREMSNIGECALDTFVIEESVGPKSGSGLHQRYHYSPVLGLSIDTAKRIEPYVDKKR